MELNDIRSSYRPHILVVDDESTIREMLQEAIENADYECSSAGSGEDALEMLAGRDIDVVITDIIMPGISGIELLSIIKESYSSDVIAITGYADEYSYEEILKKGASDFMSKPFHLQELIVRLRYVLRQRELITERNKAYESLESTNRQLLRYGEDLNDTILDLKATHQELKESYLDTIHRLVLAAEYKDEDTGGHIMRMSRYSALIAEKLGLHDKESQGILYAAPMHDVGKIGIPDSILMKPGKLTEEEFETMKTHSIIGANLVATSKAPVLKLAEEIALSHHEKWSGEGYPQGLSGDNIPLSGRIVGIADVFDALTSKRPYKDAFPVKRAVDIIKEERGVHFDPAITDVFLENLEKIVKIKEDINSLGDIPLANVSYTARGKEQKNNDQD